MLPLRAGIVLALFGVYALGTYCPPAATPLVPFAFGAGLTERVFPGVPGWWVWTRLAALAAGAVIAVAGAPRGCGVRAGRRRDAVEAPRPATWVAAGVALALCAWATRAAHMARPEQLALIGALALPTLLVLVTTRTSPPRMPGRGLGTVLALVGLWALAWMPIAWRSPWIASLVDGSSVLGMLARTRDQSYNLLVDTIRPGQSSAFLVLQGAGLIDWLDVTPTITFIQGLHTAWNVVCAVLLAVAAMRLVAAPTAPVAAATYLAAPIVMAQTFFMGPQYIGQLLAVSLVLCALAIHRRRSAVATAAAGLATGLMATLASLMAIAYAGMAFVVVLAVRARVPAAAIVAAVATFVACIVPVVPSLLTLPSLYAFYNSGTAEWATMQNAFFGQLDPDYVRFQLTAVSARPFDALIGSLLAPFAVPRTGLRLWGDVFFDPLGAALAAVGIAYCLRERTVASWALLGLLVLATAPGGMSSYDRASLMRLPAVPVPVVLLAAVGFRVLVTRFAPATAVRPVALGLSLLVLASGWLVMAVVNPRILPRSATGITLEAVRGTDVPDALVLVPYGWDPQSSPTFLEMLAPTPMRWAPYRTADDLARPDVVGAASLLFWSPGLEERAGVAAGVCARWPAARLYVMTDAAGLSRSFAATTDGRPWEPAVPAWRWTALPCPATLPTEASAAARARATARGLVEQGRQDEAVATLRDAARGSVLAFALYDELARQLLATAATSAELEEAAFWARRAASTSGYCAADPVLTLRQAYARLGREDQVRATEERQRSARETTCRQLAADHPLRP